MPIYEYQCEACGNRFEKLVRRASEATTAVEEGCPSCGRHEVHQEYSTFAPRMGSGASKAPEMGGCPAGMCATPGLCGRN